MKNIYLIVIISIISVACYSQIPTNLAQSLQEELNNIQNEHDFKGLSVAVSYKSSDIWTTAVGKSNDTLPLTPNMLIGIGSQTKTFISTIILKLQENQLLTLQDTIGKWINGYPQINPAITIQQLLNHTSGLPEYTTTNTITDSLIYNDNKFWLREELLKIVPSNVQLPGSNFSYSNTNYLLAGAIAEAITGQTIAQLLRTYIFQPCKLMHTYYPPFETINNETFAQFWTDMDGDGNFDATLNWNINTQPLPININTIAQDAGAIVATAEDIVMYSKNLFEGNIITKSTINNHLLAWSGFGNTNFDYGAGIFKEIYNNQLVFTHGGTWIGQINSNLSDTNNAIYISVLSNQDKLDNEYTEKVVERLHAICLNYQLSGSNIAKLKFNVYPNPANRQLYIEGDEKITAITIADINGRNIKLNQKTTNKGIVIDISQLNHGIIILNIQTNKGAYFEKITIE